MGRLLRSRVTLSCTTGMMVVSQITDTLTISDMLKAFPEIRLLVLRETKVKLLEEGQFLLAGAISGGMQDRSIQQVEQPLRLLLVAVLPALHLLVR